MIRTTIPFIIITWMFSVVCAAHGQSPSHRIISDTAGGFILSCYLPPGYDPLQRYKVLYVNDGQTIFGKFGLDIDATADDLIGKKLIEPIIIIGIHSDSNRTSNYVPYADESAEIDFGKYQPNAASYSKKLVDELIPYIERKYKSLPARGIAGYSFGGLHATWIALNYAAVFSFSGSLSPSYWVDNFRIFREAPKAMKTQTYYFDVGTGEWNYYVPMLLHSKLPILEKVFYYEDHGAHHDINAWRGTRIKNILLLFAGKTGLASYKWEIKQEVIRSSYSGKFYLRINPVITYLDGLTCSISYAATFTLLNEGDGVVNKDGSFYFINKNDLHVKVEYRGENKMIRIDYNEVEKTRSGL